MGRKIGKEKRNAAGQVLAEYAVILSFCVFFTLMFFVLMAAFSEYGMRVIGLVSWEPNPPDRSQMEKIVNGTL